MSGFSNPIVGGAESLIRSAIKSPNYTPGVIGWIVSKDGSAEFNNALFRGELRVDGTGNAYILIYERPVPNRPTIELMPNVVGAVPAEIFADNGQLFISAPALPPEVGGATLVLDDSNPGVHKAQFYSSQAGATMTLEVQGGLDLVLTQTDSHIRINNVDGMVQMIGNPASVIANSGAIGGAGVETVTLTLAARNWVQGRAYRLDYSSLYNVSVAPNRPIFTFRKTNNVGQILRTCDLAAVNTGQHTAELSCIFTVGAATVNAALVITLGTNSAGFTVTQLASAGQPSWLIPYDIGAAANYANAPVLV